MEQPIPLITINDLEKFADSLFTDKDFSDKDGRKAPTKYIRENFSRWRAKMFNKQMKSFNGSDGVTKSEIRQTKKEINNLYLEMEDALEMRDNKKSYYLLAQILGKTDCYKKIAKKVIHKKAIANVFFKHYLDDSVLDILDDLINWYNDKPPLELIAMLLALDELNLLDPEMNIFENKEQLTKILTSTFGGKQKSGAFKKYTGGNRPSRTTVKLQIKIIKDFPNYIPHNLSVTNSVRNRR
jgi:hypothetical protein